MFKRGNGPLVSVLFPTRKRVSLLINAVSRLYDLAKDKNLIEFVFKIDMDDLETISVVEKLAKSFPCVFYISPRGAGYKDLDKFWNQLAGIASGDWLMIFNDDAKMMTNNWDQVLLNVNPWSLKKFKGNSDVCVLGCVTSYNSNYNWQHPIVRRKVYEILGHLTRVVHVDHYLYTIMKELNAAVVSNELVIDSIDIDDNDITKKEGRNSYTNLELSSHLYNDDIILKQKIDVEKLSNYLNLS